MIIKKKIYELKIGDKVKLKSLDGKWFVGTVESVNRLESGITVKESVYDFYGKSFSVIVCSSETAKAIK